MWRGSVFRVCLFPVLQELAKVTVKHEQEQSEKLLQMAVVRETQRSEQLLSQQHERLSAALEEEKEKQEEKMKQALQEAQQKQQVSEWVSEVREGGRREGGILRGWWGC